METRPCGKKKKPSCVVVDFLFCFVLLVCFLSQIMGFVYFPTNMSFLSLII